MNKNVQSQLDVIGSVLNAAHDVVSKMNDGERMQIKSLAQQVARELSMEAKTVLNFVNHFAHNTDLAYVTRGKHGGLIKGTKPVKVVKPAKAAKTAPVSSDSN